MEQTILTPQQQSALRLVSKEPGLQSFYLSGGTALAAYHLHHRFSEDLDFFSFEMPDALFLQGFTEEIKKAVKAQTVDFQHVYDRYLFEFSSSAESLNLKVEFTKYQFPQFEKPKVVDGVRIDSFRDIAANKLMALLDRFDPKDFVDLYFILKQSSLESVWRDAEKKFDMRIDPVFLGGELAKARRIAGLPRLLKPLTVEELKHFFSEEAKKLSPSIFL